MSKSTTTKKNRKQSNATVKIARKATAKKTATFEVDYTDADGELATAGYRTRHVARQCAYNALFRETANEASIWMIDSSGTRTLCGRYFMNSKGEVDYQRADVRKAA